MKFWRELVGEFCEVFDSKYGLNQDIISETNDNLQQQN